MVIDNLSAKSLTPILNENIAKEARVMTDDAKYYNHLAELFAEHGTVAHSKGEYGRGDIHTNRIEGFFLVFKRGMRGIYQHCAKRHLHRYMAEFDFRYSNGKALGIEDEQRAELALMGIKGKRLTYQTIGA